MTHPLKAALGSPLYRKLLAIRLTGQAGDGMLQSALATFVLFSPERQASASAIAAAFAILALPYSLIGPFTGVLLDRWRRQRVLLWGNLLRALSMIPVIYFTAQGDSGVGLGVSVLAAIGINRFVLAFINFRRAGKFQDAIVHTSGFDHATFQRNVAKQYGQTAVGAVRMGRITDTAVSTVGIERFPTFVL